MRGELEFDSALKERVGLLAGMSVADMQQVYDDRIRLTPGARDLVQTLSANGVTCVLVSGGFTYFTSRIAAKLGFHDHQGNELIFNQGKLTGEAQDPILGSSAKLNTLMSLCDEKGLSPSDVLAVGDGANDIKMIQAAGLGVSFHDTGSLREQSDAVIDFADLTALLYIQGFRKSEFVLT
jgi:phosphoserine phosphatase